MGLVVNFDEPHGRPLGLIAEVRCATQALSLRWVIAIVNRRASLARVLDDLGILLELLHGSARRSSAIGGVVIHDPLEEPVLPSHALVLGVGLREPTDIAQLLRSLGRHAAVGLVVRAPLVVSDELATAVDESGVSLLGLSRGASWSQLAAMARAILAEGDIDDIAPSAICGIPSGALFALANAIAASVDAPVTIEDRNSNVLAFSGRQGEADDSRVETILGRRVPERFARVLTKQGIFHDLYRSDCPIYVKPFPGVAVPRAAMAVRAGDEVLGSIWAAVPGPLSTARTQALCDAAKLVALHLLHARASADIQRRRRTDLVSTALDGGPGAREALDRLRLGDTPIVVLALTSRRSEQPDADLITQRQRLADALAVHLSAVHPRSAAAMIGDVCYGLLPAHGAGPDNTAAAVRIATDFLDRVGDRGHAVIGIGPPAPGVAGLSESRASADRALRVLVAGHSRRVARLADIYVESLLLELRDLVAARGDQPAGPVVRLRTYDRQRGTGLLNSLRAWLDHFGDVNAAADAVSVHPNTFRYRLRRVAEIGGLDLADPDTRFGIMLQLRLLPPEPDSSMNFGLSDDLSH